jgi:hypothetical protein
MDQLSMHRRGFISATAGALAAGAAAADGKPAEQPTSERPVVTNPRATSGDSVAEPDWQDRLTITVGPENADLVGTNHRVLHAVQLPQ